MTAGDIVDLLRIAVRPDARRAGIASRLLDELLVDTEGAVADAAGGERDQRRRPRLLRGAGSSASSTSRPHYYRDGSEALVMCRWLPGAARAHPATAA